MAPSPNWGGLGWGLTRQPPEIRKSRHNLLLVYDKYQNIVSYLCGFSGIMDLYP